MNRKALKMKLNNLYLIIISFFLIFSSCSEKKHLNRERFILNHLHKNSYCFNVNVNETKYVNLFENVNDILSPQRRYFDKVNEIKIEHHYWVSNACAINHFYILEYKDSLYFMPFCDEQSLFKNKSVAPENESFFIEKEFNNFLNSNKLKDPEYFTYLFFDSAYFNNRSYKKKFISGLLSRELEIKKRVLSNSKKKNYKYYYPVSGANALWEVIYSGDSVNFNILNRENIYCGSY